MNQFLQSFEEFNTKYLRFYDEGYLFKTLSELYLLLMITIPLSLLLFLLFSKGKHKMLVDLGRGHRWLVK